MPKRVEHRSSGPERLQKVLAAAGIGSRRVCEEFIVNGRVEVDGEIVVELGTRVDPASQRIRVDGTTLLAPRRVYYMLNKPTGVLCTNRDPSGRARAVDMIRSNERLFTVGRLDQSSEGLLLVTNDGDLSNKLTHPKYGIEKVYRVRVAGAPEAAVLAKLKRGIHFAEGVAKVSDVKIKNRQKQSTTLEIVLTEGRNREIRRLLARIGHKVLSLTRIAMGPLRLADLPSGAHRSLTREEVKALRNAVLGDGKKPARNTPRKTAARNKPTRLTGDLKSKAKGTKRKASSPQSRSSGNTSSRRPSKTVSARPKKQTRERAITDRPSTGAILGGDETSEPKKRAGVSRKKNVSAKKRGTKRLTGRKSARTSGKPSKRKATKKGRR